MTFVGEECKFLSAADKKAIFPDNFIKYIKQAGGRDLWFADDSGGQAARHK